MSAGMLVEPDLLLTVKGKNTPNHGERAQQE